MNSSICRAMARISNKRLDPLAPGRARSARRSGASSNLPSAAAMPSASLGSTITAHGPQISAKPPRPEVMSAAPLAMRLERRPAERFRAGRQHHSDRGAFPRRFDLGIGHVRIDLDPAVERPGGIAKRLNGFRLQVGGRWVGHHETGAPFGPRRQNTCDRRHGFDMTFVPERAAHAEDRPVLRFGRRPGLHVEAVGHGALKRAKPWEISAELAQGILADEGEAGKPTHLLAPEGSIKPARRRLDIGVGLQNHPRSRGQRDERRRRQMIFDNGEIDAAAPQQLRDAPRFSEIAADSGIGNRRDLDALERLVHRRADNQRRCAHIGYERPSRERKARPKRQAAARNAHCAASHRQFSARAPFTTFGSSGRDAPPARVLTRKVGSRQSTHRSLPPAANFA